MPILDNIHTVPAELICNILFAAGVNDNITIDTWKGALSFLWVCKRWRLVAEPILFSMLICGSVDYDNSRSNYELIIQRRCFDNVKKIIVGDQYSNSNNDPKGDGYPDHIDMLKSFGKLFDDENGRRDINLLEFVECGAAFELECYARNTDPFYNSSHDKFDFEYFSDQFGNRVLYNEEELNARFKDASTNIVSKLAALFPNVTHLFFGTRNWSTTNNVLTSILINYYMEQLVLLEHNLPIINFKLNSGHNIRSLTLGDYNPGCGKLSQLSPHFIKNISLSFNGNFSWDLFKTDGLAPVSYNSLTRLVLNGIDKTPEIILRKHALLNCATENMPQVLFPRLRVLVLRDIWLSDVSLRHFLSFPVKILCVNGYIQHVYQLYEHNLDNIDILILNIDCYYFDKSDDAQTEFIQPFNKLLAKVGNISEVHLELDLRFVVFDLTNISWIYLTHLYVNVGEQANHVFTVIFKMPNLVYLDVTIGTHAAIKACKCIINFFIKLRHGYSGPIKSKIKRIHIRCANFSPSAEFLDALECLKQYLPKLEKLIVE